MLKILHNIGEVNFSEMLNVYAEQLTDKSVAGSVMFVQEHLCDDISLFLSEENTTYCVWVYEERYVSCVRCEPYKDGILLTCLETVPGERRKGYAFMLLQELLDYAGKRGMLPAYVHIHNRNSASIALHKRLGFHVIADSARLVDGTVSTAYCTMKYE